MKLIIHFIAALDSLSKIHIHSSSLFSHCSASETTRTYRRTWVEEIEPFREFLKTKEPDVKLATVTRHSWSRAENVVLMECY